MSSNPLNPKDQTEAKTSKTIKSLQSTKTKQIEWPNGRTPSEITIKMKPTNSENSKSTISSLINSMKAKIIESNYENKMRDSQNKMNQKSNEKLNQASKQINLRKKAQNQAQTLPSTNRQIIVAKRISSGPKNVIIDSTKPTARNQSIQVNSMIKNMKAKILESREIEKGVVNEVIGRIRSTEKRPRIEPLSNSTLFEDFDDSNWPKVKEEETLDDIASELQNQTSKNATLINSQMINPTIHENSSENNPKSHQSAANSSILIKAEPEKDPDKHSELKYPTRLESSALTCPKSQQSTVSMKFKSKKDSERIFESIHPTKLKNSKLSSRNSQHSAKNSSILIKSGPEETENDSEKLSEAINPTIHKNFMLESPKNQQLAANFLYSIKSEPEESVKDSECLSEAINPARFKKSVFNCPRSQHSAANSLISIKTEPKDSPENPESLSLSIFNQSSSSAIKSEPQNSQESIFEYFPTEIELKSEPVDESISNIVINYQNTEKKKENVEKFCVEDKYIKNHAKNEEYVENLAMKEGFFENDTDKEKVTEHLAMIGGNIEVFDMKNQVITNFNIQQHLIENVFIKEELNDDEFGEYEVNYPNYQENVKVDDQKPQRDGFEEVKGLIGLRVDKNFKEFEDLRQINTRKGKLNLNLTQCSSVLSQIDRSLKDFEDFSQFNTRKRKLNPNLKKCSSILPQNNENTKNFVKKLQNNSIFDDFSQNLSPISKISKNCTKNLQNNPGTADLTQFISSSTQINRNSLNFEKNIKEENPNDSDNDDDDATYQYNTVNSFKADTNSKRTIHHTIINEKNSKSQMEIIEMAKMELSRLSNKSEIIPPQIISHQCSNCLTNFSTKQQLLAHEKIHASKTSKIDAYKEVKMKIVNIGKRRSFHVLLPSYDYAFVVTNSTQNKLFMKCFKSNCDVKAYSTSDGKFYLKQGDKHSHEPEADVILSKINAVQKTIVHVQPTSTIASEREKAKTRNLLEEKKLQMIAKIRMKIIENDQSEESSVKKFKKS